MPGALRKFDDFREGAPVSTAPARNGLSGLKRWHATWALTQRVSTTGRRFMAFLAPG